MMYPRRDKLAMARVRSGLYLSRDGNWQLKRTIHLGITWWNVHVWDANTRSFTYLRAFYSMSSARRYIQMEMMGGRE